MMADSDVQIFLDEVLQNAIDIFERKTKTNIDPDTATVNAPSMSEKICNPFLEEIYTKAVDDLSEKLAVIGQFDHKLHSQQDCVENHRPNGLECEVVGRGTELERGHVEGNEALAIQSGCTQAGDYVNELDKSPYEGIEPSHEDSTCTSSQRKLNEAGHGITEVKQEAGPLRELRATLADMTAQNYHSEVQLQSPKDTNRSKESPKSANIFFRLAKELLEGGCQDYDVAQSQPPSLRKLTNSEDEESSSCPCRFDWGLEQQGIDDDLGDDARDVIDILEMNGVDELMAEDQEVPGDLGLDVLLEPEETVEISLYGTDDMKAMSSPLDLDDIDRVEKPPRDQLCEIPPVDVLSSPEDPEEDGAGTHPGRTQRRMCEPSSEDDLSSLLASDPECATACSDPVPGHRWFQTTSGAGPPPAEPVRRVTPIPSCNRRRRVGLSRTQRVPSLHSKRLRLSEE